MGLSSIQDGHQVTVAALDGGDEPWWTSFELPAIALGCGRGTYGYAATASNRLSAASSGADLVVADGLWQYQSRLVHRVCAGRIPYVVYPHGMLDPWFKRQYPLKHLKKYLYWLTAEYAVLRDAQAVVFTADDERLLARESFRPYRVNEAVQAIGSAGAANDAEAIDRQRAAFAGICPEVADKPFILFLSRIHEKKGIDLLLTAFQRQAAAHPQLELVVAGPDPDQLQSRLMATVTDAEVAKRIHWPGMLRGDAKWGAFRAARGFCLPSHQENFGLVIAEALACGAPVLTTTQVNIWREVVAAGAGLAVSDNAPAIGDMLGKFLALNATEILIMGEQAMKLFQQTFAIATAARARNQFFSKVIAHYA
jgi:glycosyltransferase involved in cell wall biosynthesis